MISSLTGTVQAVSLNTAVLNVNGFGMLVNATPGTLSTLHQGREATVHTSMVVREDSMTLFGFAEEGEREAFELAQTATGVGPKLALAIVSVLTPSDLRRAVQAEDLARLCSVPGIGRKGAQKLVIELKDKVLALAAEGEDTVTTASPEQPEVWRAQVSEGLQGLGWSARDAEAACDNVAHLVEENPDLGMGQLLRAALNSLARK